jgi:hypothetical protein
MKLIMISAYEINYDIMKLITILIKINYVKLIIDI